MRTLLLSTLLIMMGCETKKMDNKIVRSNDGKKYLINHRLGSLYYLSEETITHIDGNDTIKVFKIIE